MQTTARPSLGIVDRAIQRIAKAGRPDVTVTPPPADAVAEWDVPVRVRDGTILRANVFRPRTDVAVPIILSAHPYGKDRIPAKTRSGRGLNFQNRLFLQPQPYAISAWTSWEAPDPAFWVPHGFAVVNLDLRGAGTSEGTGELLSDQEAQDYYDAIEWAASQPWSNGRVGLDGVSYLAISQYKVAALRPPHLAAICPWEGFTDLYRDFARPGGSREDGFLPIWSTTTAKFARLRGDLRSEVVAREQRDDWYAARTPDLERIDVPMLVCASFSDHSLHSRGSFEAFRRAGTARKWMYTHRGGKWSTYYGEDASRTRLRFFEHTLKGIDNGWEREPRVRLAVTERGSEPAAVIHEAAFPPHDLTWNELALDVSTRRFTANRPTVEASVAFRTLDGSLRWAWTIPHGLDAIGPMTLRLWCALADGGDATLFVGARKVARDGIECTFEGSYGFAGDMPSKGWQRLSHRELDPSLSAPEQPVHTHATAEPLAPGEIVPVDIALLPHATRFRTGETLVIEVRGTWFFPRDPVRGQFPAWYQSSPPATVIVHAGGRYDSGLLLGTRSFTTPPA